MYVHPDAKVGFFAHPRTGSTATKNWLLERGFIRVKGHHQAPWGTRRKASEGIVYNNRWWWNERQWEYQFYATVRNHFDICLSYKHWMNHEGPITDGFLDEFAYTRNHHFYCAHTLYPAFQMIPGCRVWRYENLVGHVNSTLAVNDLPLVPIDEARVRANGTQGKPGGSYREHLSPEERAVIENRFEWEMGRFEYEW